MDTNSMFGFMDLIVLGCGVYGIYTWYMLVKKNQIIKAFLVGGDLRPEDCVDIPGFANYIEKKLMFTSIIMIVFGAVSAYNDYVQSIGPVIWVAMGAFLAILIWYCFQLRAGNMASPDIRAGIALLIAAMSAKGTSTISKIDQIDRGYEDIEIRLNALGAKITRNI